MTLHLDTTAEATVILRIKKEKMPAQMSHVNKLMATHKQQQNEVF